MRTILEIYFGYNLLMAGIYLGEREYGTGLIALLFATPLSIKELIWNYGIVQLNKIFQFKFYFEFYVLRRYRKETESSMELRNRITENHRQSNSLRDKVWRHGMRLINEANNYKK